MAIDFQVVFPQENIQLTQIRFTSPGPLNLPRGLDITGVDFSAVEMVLINDIESPDVIVIGKNRLIAQLPDSLQRTLAVTNVAVLSRRLTLTERSLIKFKISDQPGMVRGILRLVQLFIKVLFTTPGTDIFSPTSGAGALKILGATFGASSSKNIISDFVISVDTAARQLVSVQSRDPSLPTDERLMAAKVTHAGFNQDTGTVLATVELVSQAGTQATANLEL